MIRKALLLLILVAGITLIFWSGWHNLRDRRNAAQIAQQTRVDLIPNTSASDSPNAASPLLGKSAPAFTLADLDGKKVSLADFKGHPLLVNFWGTYCAPCKLEMPWIEEFSHKYAADGFRVIGITYDTEVGLPTITKDAHKLGVTYPILLSDSKTEKDYLSDSEVLPMSFYVDKSGKVIEVTAGLGSKQQLEAMVKETMAAGAQ